jgi:PAS domain S-box-containing protein
MNEYDYFIPDKLINRQTKLGSFLQIVNRYSNILGKTKSINEFNETQSELFSHMQLLDSSSLLSVSDLQGNIIYANDNFCKVSKYSREELLGQPHSIVRHPDTPSSIFVDLWNTIRNRKVWHGELKNRSKDGSFYWVLATIAPILGKNGKPEKYISLRVDITKQKFVEDELEDAKVMIDIHLHENVRYAKIVHNSFLTSNDDIDIVFDQSFLIYKALKIISGDFYRVETVNKKAVLMLGDSTGHGVSASYISIMVLNIFTHLIKLKIDVPAEILLEIHKEIRHIRHQNKKNPLNETADIIICCIDMHSMQMRYVSSNIRGVIIRQNELIDLKRDRCLIGELTENDFELTSYSVTLKKDDCIYLFSDGMTDQLGGKNNKTFRIKKLKDVLLANNQLEMKQQKKNISKSLTEWQGENDQTDDMSMLAFKIS